jgi:hypothetical protein
VSRGARLVGDWVTREQVKIVARFRDCEHPEVVIMALGYDPDDPTLFDRCAAAQQGCLDGGAYEAECFLVGCEVLAYFPEVHPVITDAAAAGRRLAGSARERCEVHLEVWGLAVAS